MEFCFHVALLFRSMTIFLCVVCYRNFCVYLEFCLFIHRLGRINYAFNHSRESPDGVTTQDHISSSSTNEDENLSEEVDEFGNYLYIFFKIFKHI